MRRLQEINGGWCARSMLLSRAWGWCWVALLCRGAWSGWEGCISVVHDNFGALEQAWAQICVWLLERGYADLFTDCITTHAAGLPQRINKVDLALLSLARSSDSFAMLSAFFDAVLLSAGGLRL